MYIPSWVHTYNIDFLWQNKTITNILYKADLVIIHSKQAHDDLYSNIRLSKEEIEKTVLENEKTIAQLEGRTPKKVIIVPGKIVNIVG